MTKILKVPAKKVLDKGERYRSSNRFKRLAKKYLEEDRKNNPS